MKFIMAYSGGKDSTLALHKLIEAGHEPVALVCLTNKGDQITHMHFIPGKTLDEFQDALGIPVVHLPLNQRAAVQEKAEKLIELKELYGAQAYAAGDIDFAWARKQQEACAQLAGLELLLPLWGMDREACVRESLALGYRCIIKSVFDDRLDDSYLGRALSPELIDEFIQLGIDPCGENGEYHTIVVDGPIFKHPIEHKECLILSSGKGRFLLN